MNESNRVISGSLFILASIAVAFILNFSQPIMVPFVLALLLRILIDPIIDFQTINLRVHRFIAVFLSICLIVLLFSIIVPFIVSSVATFLESADDYNQKVIILIDAVIIKLQEFEIKFALLLNIVPAQLEMGNSAIVFLIVSLSISISNCCSLIMTASIKIITF